MENKLYLCSSTHTFLDVFRASNFDEQSLMSELFLHNIIYEHVSMKMVVTIFSYMGDLQLRAFMSFMRNHIEWHLSTKSMDANEENTTLRIWVEPGRAAALRQEFRIILSTTMIREPTATYKRRIVNFFLNQISVMNS